MRTTDEVKRLASQWREQRHCIRASYDQPPNCCILTTTPCAPTDPVCLHPSEGCPTWAAIEVLWRAALEHGTRVDLRILARSFHNAMTDAYLVRRFQQIQP
jgi:hypothetical protein